MIAREMVKDVLDRYCQGVLTADEAADWAYGILGQGGDAFEDEVVAEAMYNLVSFHSIGNIFADYRPCQGKLEYLSNWLTDGQQGDWNQYQQLFTNGQLIKN
ncbi:MAG: hypothetical protein M0021_01825 [Clostridia bacterium]|nr:hypothetical protein [Clostridia bacterium]